MPLRGKACKGGESPDAPAGEKRAKVRSHLMPLRGKAHESGESPDAPARKSVQRWGVT